MHRLNLTPRETTRVIKLSARVAKVTEGRWQSCSGLGGKGMDWAGLGLVLGGGKEKLVLLCG